MLNYIRNRFKKSQQSFIPNHSIKTTDKIISDLERANLKSIPQFTEGMFVLEDRNFYYSDALAFLHSVDEIYTDEIYKFKSKTDTPIILDCGANIGLSVAYFSKLYPQSKIIAFEPDPNIFRILQKNCSEITNTSITLVEAAVWSEDTTLEFFLEGTLGGSLNVDYRNDNNLTKVKAVDLKKYLQSKVDFLKIDIEGAENTLIFDIQPLLKNVDKLFLEYHGLLNEKQNLGDILNLLSDSGFEYYIRVAGETLKYPFFDQTHNVFNQQLNIFCYRLQ